MNLTSLLQKNHNFLQACGFDPNSMPPLPPEKIIEVRTHTLAIFYYFILIHFAIVW